MPDSIKIIIEDTGVRTLLSGMAERLRDMTPAMREVASIMTESTQLNFEAEGRPRWPALKPSTIAGREAKGYWPGKILQIRGGRGGGLASSITQRYDAASAEVGTNAPHAAIHQFGGTTRPHVIKAKSKKGLYWPGASHPVRQVNHPGSTIPARPFLNLTEDDLTEIRAVLGRYAAGE